jgi:hypothetical protein
MCYYNVCARAHLCSCALQSGCVYLRICLAVSYLFAHIHLFVLAYPQLLRVQIKALACVCSHARARAHLSLCVAVWLCELAWMPSCVLLCLHASACVCVCANFAPMCERMSLLFQSTCMCVRLHVRVRICVCYAAA